jgi:proline utilization trans-activator
VSYDDSPGLSSLTLRTAKHAFIDLDSVFSVGFIFVLVEAINPGKEMGISGINGARAILQYLENLGNHAAARRLAEIDQMCSHLSLPTKGANPQSTQFRPNRNSLPDQGQDVGMQMLWMSQEASVSEPTAAGVSAAAEISINSDQNMLDPADFAIPRNFATSTDQGPLFSNTDMANISLEGEDLYGMYHTPGFAYTGVDHANWEALDGQMTWHQ